MAVVVGSLIRNQCFYISQNIEWLIWWTFTKIRKILHPSENNTPVTICRNQEFGIEKSFRRKTPCTHYSHRKGLKSGTRYPTRICNARITSTQTNIIWSRHCLDASTAFLSGQCVYIWVKVEYHKIIWVGMAYREDISIWN